MLILSVGVYVSYVLLAYHRLPDNLALEAEAVPTLSWRQAYHTP